MRKRRHRIAFTRERSLHKWYLLATAAAAVLAACAIATSLLLSRRSAPATGAPRAVIADQLALTDPDPAFVLAAARELHDAGYEVDYVDTHAITVDFFRLLPARKYDIIILRTHSYGSVTAGGAVPGTAGNDDLVSLFTSEPYTTVAHVGEQRSGAVDRVRLISPARERAFFGVTTDFVRTSMRGRLDGAIVLLMGCGGMSNLGMARALVDRGATAVAGWDGLVTAGHTDAVVERLLRHLAADRAPVAGVTARTMSEIGPDPVYGSRFVSYP